MQCLTSTQTSLNSYTAVSTLALVEGRTNKKNVQLTVEQMALADTVHDLAYKCMVCLTWNCLMSCMASSSCRRSSPDFTIIGTSPNKQRVHQQTLILSTPLVHSLQFGRCPYGDDLRIRSTFSSHGSFRIEATTQATMQQGITGPSVVERRTKGTI